MNAFYEHHKNSIRFNYRCFDRIVLNGLIQPFQQPERAVDLFSTYREQYPVSRDVLTEIADPFQNWLKGRSEEWGAPVLDAPAGRRDEFVEAYLKKTQPDEVAVILKARESARILTAIGNKKENRWHLQISQRWVNQYNFYVNDRQWGRMFVRMCPYFPFSARICLNQHHWLANLRIPSDADHDSEVMAISVPREADQFSAVLGMVIAIVGIFLLNRLHEVRWANQRQAGLH